MGATAAKLNTTLTCINAHESVQIRSAISLVLAAYQPPLKIIETAGHELLLKTEGEVKSDLIILDYYAASALGFKLLDELQLLKSHALILVICDYIEDIVASRMKEYQVRAFVSETSLYVDLTAALESVLRGNSFISRYF